MTVLHTTFSGIEIKTREDVERLFWEHHERHRGNRRTDPRKVLRIVQIRKSSGHLYHWTVHYSIPTGLLNRIMNKDAVKTSSEDEEVYEQMEGGDVKVIDKSAKKGKKQSSFVRVYELDDPETIKSAVKEISDAIGERAGLNVWVRIAVKKVK